MASTGAGVFRCPSCKEFISVDARECRFCGVSVNAENAKNLTLQQTELDNAIGGARTIKVIGPSALALVPLTALLGLIYPVVLTIVIEVMAVRWLSRFRKVQTPEVRRLRRHVWVIASLAATLFVIVILLSVLSFVFRALRSQ